MVEACACEQPSAPGRRAARRLTVALLAAASAVAVTVTLTRATLNAQACSGNPTVCENQLPGSPASQWDVAGSGDSAIQGFATDISVTPGDTVSFKIDTTNATAIALDIYRMGYYGGSGARKITTFTSTLVTHQQPCLTDDATGLVDCGNWLESASWQVPADAVSGIYFAKITRMVNGARTGGGSHIVFIVRDDTRRSDLLFQTSDTTWQAYNSYGGNSLYTGAPGTNPARAYKVSYNRPFITRGGDEEHDWVFYSEYPMVRWLEANGFDVSYAAGVDTDRRGSTALQQHRVFMSVGHDEYWSGGQRANVEAARNAGVHLAFFSGNEMFWKTRWENSIDGSNTPYRTLVCYKETHANAKIDPTPTWTGTWRDARFSPPADGGRPENAVSGTIFMVNEGATTAIQVPAAFANLRFWRNITAITSLQPGQTATLAANTLGYEWDADLDNGFRPNGLMQMSSRTVTNSQVLQDNGSNYGNGTVTHSLTLYRHPTSGALVFGAGTVQWSWGLDGTHDLGGLTAPAADVRMQQATVNLFADMGAQPGTLQAGLTAATQSVDTLAPTSTITSPANGAVLTAGSAVTIAGTAQDVGGGIVSVVEVSVDGGLSWHRAAGTTSWTFTWTPTANGTATIRSRASDDSGFVESPSAGVTVTVGGGGGGGGTCPCTIWVPTAGPANPSVADGNAVELGVKLRSNVAGFITGIRYYKSTQNSGTHLAHLWSATGTLLASATFSGESASGWQQVNFASPVAISANTTYIASYYAPVGFYAGDNGYFASAVTRGPLTALADGADGGNGVYRYGTSGFPSSTFQSSNYWVDAVFTTTSGPDVTPPTVSSVSPPNNASGVSTGTAVSVVFNEAMDASTINTSTILLKDPTSNVVSSNVTWSAGSFSATLKPASPLLNSTAYTVTVVGGSTDPRVKDVAGNALGSTFTSTFTTGAPPPPPPNDGPGGPILVVSSSTNPFTRYYAEILRAEGLNAFLAADITTVTPTVLSSYDVVILGEMPLTAAQVTMFSDWVNAGGNLIAMRPDKQLATLLGLTDAGTTLPEAYLLVNTGAAPGAGIVGQTMQFHGTADRYTISGATPVATLYSNRTSATSNPAVTVRPVGTAGGQAAAFTYDLARSVVYTRQGNPAWSGQERDGETPIRSDDLFFGGAEPNWVDLTKVAIPQADEQQRLLANLVLFMNADRKPLPRFWYLPRGLKAAVVMTGDDHGNNGTAGRFDIYTADSPSGCSVTNWECVRATSYIYPGTPLDPAQAAAFVANGFEIGTHVTTLCADYTPQSLESDFANDLADFKSNFPALPSPQTNRTHCITWSDYSTHPQTELAHGIRFDTNYYYWPPAWVNDVPGLFTGSGMPMRFAKQDGTLIDVYQATTQMTDESGQSYPLHIDTLLDRALGPEGYYGVFTANMHTDQAVHEGSEAIVASAQARGVPIVSSKQMLDWLDGRNGSSFANITWSNSTLSFTVAVGNGANRLSGLLPASVAGATLSSLTRNGAPVATTTATIKGVAYAIFDAAAGNYQASYQGDAATPALSIADATVTEGNSGTTNAVFTVTLSAPSSQAVTVNYATADGAATVAGNDYVAASGPLTFQPGDVSKTVTVSVVGDTVFEPNETFTVNLSGATNATIARAQGTGTILNDDTAPTLSINDVSVPEGNSGTANAVFTVTLSAASTSTTTVNYATANGTATSGSDFTATSGTLSFAPGTVSQTINVPVIGDTTPESNENFTVNLSSPVNATIARAQGTGTIVNDDAPGLSIGNVTVTEADTTFVNAQFRVTLSVAASQPVSVHYATADGTATAGADYTATSGTLTIPAGSTAGTITVPVRPDTIDEANETFTVNLSSAVNATITQAQGVGTITDNDPLPVLSLNDVSVTEGSSGTQTAVFTVKLTGTTTARTVTVHYATANGSPAATAGSDYVATSGTLTFAPGVTTQTVSVLVNGDLLDEPNETFNVNLSSATNAVIVDSLGVGTIIDDDPAPSVSINSVSLLEGNTGTRTPTFTLTLSAPSSGSVTVNYATADGTATAGSDYTAKSGTVTFAAGTTSRTITVSIVGNTTAEPDETFFVNLSAPVNATVANGQGVGTILNDD